MKGQSYSNTSVANTPASISVAKCKRSKRIWRCVKASRGRMNNSYTIRNFQALSLLHKNHSLEQCPAALLKHDVDMTYVPIAVPCNEKYFASFGCLIGKLNINQHFGYSPYSFVKRVINNVSVLFPPRSVCQNGQSAKNDATSCFHVVRIHNPKIVYREGKWHDLLCKHYGLKHYLFVNDYLKKSFFDTNIFMPTKRNILIMDYNEKRYARKYFLMSSTDQGRMTFTKVTDNLKYEEAKFCWPDECNQYAVCKSNPMPFTLGVKPAYAFRCIDGSFIANYGFVMEKKIVWTRVMNTTALR